MPQEMWSRLKEGLDKGQNLRKLPRYELQDDKKDDASLLTCLSVNIPCCSHNDEYVHADRIKITACIGQENTSIFTYYLLINTDNLIRKDIPLKLQKQEATLENISNKVMSGVGNHRYRVRISHQVRLRLRFDITQGIDSSSVNRFLWCNCPNY